MPGLKSDEDEMIVVTAASAGNRKHLSTESTLGTI
jgi:hypothetical protein